MHIRHIFDTPWTPYAVTFSHDGRRLAMAGGSWYGGGGIRIYGLPRDLASAKSLKAGCSKKGQRATVPTISGLCFSRDDRHLAASGWLGRQYPAEAMLFRTRDVDLGNPQTLKFHWKDQVEGPCPTGILFYNGGLMMRSNATTIEDVFYRWKSLPDHSVCFENPQYHLTNSRFIIRRGQAITGGGGSLKMGGWRRDQGQFEQGKACSGMVVMDLIKQEAAKEWQEDTHCRRITAVSTLTSEDQFLSGGLDGEVDLWRYGTHWRRESLRKAPKPEKKGDPQINWATYTPASIVGICSLCDGHRYVTLDASGELVVWENHRPITPWQLPLAGTPRSIAAHPTEPLLAVSLKQGTLGSQSKVVLISL